MIQRRSIVFSAALGLLITVCGCNLIRALIAIPFIIIIRVTAFCMSLLIGAEGVTSMEEELHASGMRIERSQVDVTVSEDLTFEGTLEVERRVTAPAGLALAQRAEFTYDPASQKVDLVIGQVRKPDGTTIDCDPSQVIDRPSAAAEGTPGFVSTRTMTVLFPQLSVGSHTHVKWHLKERGQSTLGLNYAWRTPFALPVDYARITIRYPGTLPLHWRERGGFKVDERVDGATATVEAVLEKYAGQVPERAMVAPRDVCPIFVVSTIENRERIGALFHDAFASKIEATPAITQKAAQIAGTVTGIEAARAIHRWVAANVLYLAVHLEQGSGWEPHSAVEVLKNGYGDCKDQVALEIALLSARGIAAEPTLIDRQFEFESLPLATPLEFDHCIAYLPDFDLYSDPTDPTRDLGELDVGMRDKLVVIGTPKGRVARTPAAVPEHNRCIATHRCELRTDGTIQGHSVLKLEGRPASRMRAALTRVADASRVADDLLFDTPEGGTGRLTSSDPTDLGTPLVCEGDFVSESVVAMGDEILVPVPIGIDLATPARARQFVSTGERRFPLVASAIDFEWTIEVSLPDGYRLERTPAANSLENATGSFSSRYEKTSDRQMTVHRRLRVAKDLFAASEVAGLQAVLAAFLADSHAVIVATKK